MASSMRRREEAKAADAAALKMAETARNAVAVAYPGYNPSGPYTLPQQRGEVLSTRKLITDILQQNGHTLSALGIRRDVTRFVLSKAMQLFFLDAFWWMYLQHFAAVDFDALVERTRRNVLVTDIEMMTYMSNGPAQPKRPHKKTQQTADGDPRKKRLPAHVAGHRGNPLRRASDVVAIGTPSLTSETAHTLAVVLDNATGVAADSDEESSVASSMSISYSPRSDTSGGTARSDITDESAATVDGVMRITRFPMTYPSLTKLTPEVRASIVAREQHQLFTRMASHYAQAIQRIGNKHYTAKDAITRLTPELVAQGLFAAFWLQIPYATHLFDLAFQKDVARTVSMWIGGVEKTGNPRLWPVHHMLDTVYKKALKPQKLTIRPKPPPKPAGGANTARPGLTAGGLPSGQPTLSEKLNAVGFTARSGGGAGTQPVDAVPETTGAEDTPEARKRLAVEREVATMTQDLKRLAVTHTFSQAAYAKGAGNRGRVEGGVPAPDRVTKAYHIGPRKRTVQVIKEDLDAKYRETVPWYGNPRHRVPLRDERTGTSKFALRNWSPLLQRFLISTGSDNMNRPDSIKWTS